MLATGKLKILGMQYKLGILIKKVHKTIFLYHIDSIEHILEVFLQLFNINNIKIELPSLKKPRISLLIHINRQKTSHQLSTKIYPGIYEQKYLDCSEDYDGDVYGWPQGEFFTVFVLVEGTGVFELVDAVEAFCAA